MNVTLPVVPMGVTTATLLPPVLPEPAEMAKRRGPIGPVLVSIDAFANPNDLALTCDVAGERMQDSRTSDMIFSVPHDDFSE